MTLEAWRRYMADFVEQIEREVPGIIVHNASGPPTPLASTIRGSPASSQPQTGYKSNTATTTQGYAEGTAHTAPETSSPTWTGSIRSEPK